MTAVAFAERAATGEAAGLLILHHGRGTDERDLIGLADELDPDGRLHVVAPRGPLTLPGAPGYHWYRVPRVGYPDPESFAAAYATLGAFHDELFERTGIPPARAVLGGFSMGTVMSYALGLGAERPAPAGILALSGFIPVVEGWRAHMTDRTSVRVFVSHGRDDPVIDIAFARRARELLTAGGLGVDYHETDAGHWIDASQVPLAAAWLDATLAA